MDNADIQQSVVDEFTKTKNIPNTVDGGEVPVIKRKRGRPSTKVHKVIPQDVAFVRHNGDDKTESDSGKDDVESMKQPPKRRGRKPKVTNGVGIALTENTTTTATKRPYTKGTNTPNGSEKKRGRPRKVVKDMDDDDEEAFELSSDGEDERMANDDDNSQGTKKPTQVIGLILAGDSFNYLVQVPDRREVLKVNAADAKDRFPREVIEFFEQNAVIQSFKIAVKDVCDG